MTYNIDDAFTSNNLVSEFDERDLEQLGHELNALIEADDASRSEWIENNDEWLKLASQVREAKGHPWHNAANVKYPLLTVAAQQFSSRALPNLINSNKPVMARIIGKDEDGSKLKRINRVRTFMSYQILEQMEEWVDDMDRLLFCLPIVGLCFKKSYYSPLLGRLKSVLLLPRDVILNYHATDYARARMTHRILMDSNELVEHQRVGLFRDVELHDQEGKDENPVRDEVQGLTHIRTDDEPYELFETHCWVDLDGDGYKEPYIITLHRDTGTVLRIVARWNRDSVLYSASNEVAKITAIDYFTPYIFMPDPNSAVYGIGLGSLVGPTNEAVNTVINQLLDAGTLSNLQSGFLARGIKLRGGATRFRPGEWKIVNTSGDDLRKGILPMPVRDPSQVLFQLLGLLIESGERVASVSDMMVGESPGQNQPATTTMAVLEQGLKVFTSIYKRVHRALGKEYKKLYQLDAFYPQEELYEAVLDDGDAPGMELDFKQDGMDILPASDPNMVSEAQKSLKAQSLMEKLAAGLPLNLKIVLRKMLEAEQHEDIDDLMNVPEPPPSPEVVKVAHEMAMGRAENLRENAIADADIRNKMAAAIKYIAEAEKAESGKNIDEYKTIVDAFRVNVKESNPTQEGNVSETS